MATINITGVVGTSLTQTDDTARIPVGRVVSLSDGGVAVYVKSSLSAVSTFAAVVVQEDYTVQMLTTTNAGTVGKQIGFAQTSIATGYYGWVQLSGRPKVNLLVNCAPFVPLYTTATIGQLDDATVSGAGGMVVGIISATTISTATAVTCIVSRGGAWVQNFVGT
jgi:hypothetical protein